MSLDIARQLFETGRSHALSSTLIYRAAIIEAEETPEIADTEHFAFNGTYSLAMHYLLGLGLELMLKSALVASGGPSDEKSLKDLGHDLVRTLDAAEALGFVPTAPSLRSLVDILHEPYKQHWFRYHRPDTIPLPADFIAVVATLEAFDTQLEALVGTG